MWYCINDNKSTVVVLVQEFSDILVTKFLHLGE